MQLMEEVVEQGECVNQIFKRSMEFGWTEKCLDPTVPTSTTQITLDKLSIFKSDSCSIEVIEDVRFFF